MLHLFIRDKRHKHLTSASEMDVAEDLKHALAGEPVALDVIDFDIPDLYTHQRDAYVQPITKKTVTYIVAGVFFNENGEVLMMQEAKQSCYKTWYLPAGRMEPNETIEEGVMREVEEETGLKCKPTTLIAVEARQGTWYRFTMTGVITGGKLKTLNDSDEESLQANWFPVDAVKNKTIPIRSKDVFKLIDIATAHKTSLVKHADLQPVIKPHKKLLLRIVLVHHSTHSDEVMLLVGCKQRNHLPVTLITPRDIYLQVSLFRLCQAVFDSGNSVAEIHGILSIEHSGRPAATNDGICITVLASLNGAVPSEITAKNLFDWVPVKTDDLKKEVLERCVAGQTVRLLD